MKEKTSNQKRHFSSLLVHAAFPLLVFAFVLGLPQQGEARLGESFSQCVKRYGEPIGTIEIPGLITNGVRFHRGEFSITCGFESNRCGTIVVMHLSPSDPKQQPLSRDDIDLFLNDNFGHTSWRYTLLSSRENKWKTYDLEVPRLYVASYSHVLKMLTMSIEQG
ncbi:MAG: hypothetical protein P1U58_11235 [Verrucomicrobiales bacterium]|nr:hypothetical protein [Verrucomicrobiales bacterium]